MADQSNQQTLQIVVNYKDNGASKSLQSLRNDIEAIDRASRGQGFQHLNSVAKSMAALGQAASGLKGIGPSFQQTAQAAENLFNTFKGFNPKSYSANIKAMTDSLQGIGKAFSNFNQMAAAMTKVSKLASDPNLSKNFQNMSQQIVAFAKNVTTNISDEVLNRFERLGSAMAGLSSVAGKGFNVSTAKGSASSVSSAFAGLGSNMKRVISYGYQLSKLPFKMILNPIKSIGKDLMGMTQKFQSFLSGIGRIALYRAIRTGIKMVTSSVREGVNNLYIWAGMVGNSFKPTMDSLATSFLYLKNSIGAMVSPILDAVAPAFEYLTDRIVEVLNVFNQVIATITGASTWRKALRAPATYADNISGLGHDAEDANDAVKELKRTILGFDEINKLEDKTKTTVPKDNGSNATGLYAKEGAFSFTELPIGQKALDIAKMLKDAWAKGDFTAIGTMLGKKIGNALLNVPWDTKIKPAVTKLAKSFGTLLNGMFDYTGSGGKAMWDGIAYTIYNAINTAVLGYVTFFDTVNWDGIGQGIGAALKRVLDNDNLDWDMIARALAAFPNAVINAVTGFTKKFTTQDFYNAGQNIGQTVSKALTLINWTGLFGNAMTIATGVLNALNGALEGFGWAGVKDAILTGIKKIPKDSWSNLGKQIGRAAFNIADFVANVVDVLVSAIEEGEWGKLVGGIWKGIVDRVNEKYGGWSGVAKSLADWIGKHIGTVSIIIALLAGFSLAKNLTKALIFEPIKAGLLGLGGTVKKGSWTGLVGTLSIAAGVALIFNNWDGKGAKSKLATAIGGGLTAAGIISKVTGCTFKGSLLSFGIGAALTLGISSLASTAKDKGVLSADFLKKLATSLTGAIIGFAVGGPSGAALGLTIGADIELVIKDIIPAVMQKVDDLVQKLVDALDPIINPAIDKAVDVITNRNYKPNNIYTGGATAGEKGAPSSTTYKRDLGTGASVWQMPSGDLNLPKLNYSKALEAARNRVKQAVTSGVAAAVAEVNTKTGAADTYAIKPKLDPNAASNAWTQLSQAWSAITKNNKVAKFFTEGITNQASNWWNSVKQFWSTAINGKTAKKFNIEGIVNQASTWWSSVKTFWAQAINGKNAKRFTIEGIVNQAQSWWGQVTNFWRSYISGKNAARFTTEGVQNHADAWWSQVAGFWASIVGVSTGSPFTIAGVVNDAWQWWNQTQNYWDQATFGSNLSASVEIGNPWNAFASAFNSMQTYFNNNPLTAIVQTVTQAVTTATNASKSYQSSGTKSKSSTKVSTSNGVLNLGDDAINAFKKKKKATGGVYKNGQWHDIRGFAAGGSPLSGQMFIAREAGPELVGNLGGSTAVMNNDQIVASVSAGVAQAVASVLGGGTSNEIVFKVDSETLYRMVRKGERKASGRYSTVVAIG